MIISKGENVKHDSLFPLVQFDKISTLSSLCSTTDLDNKFNVLLQCNESCSLHQLWVQLVIKLNRADMFYLEMNCNVVKLGFTMFMFPSKPLHS